MLSYSRNNISNTVKDGAYIKNLDGCKLVRTHWIALHANDNSVTYFDSFSVKHIPKEIKRFIGNNNIITSIFRIQVYNSTMSGYFCIVFIDFLFKGKIFTTQFKNE